MSSDGIFSSALILPGGSAVTGAAPVPVLPGLAGETPQATAARLLELMETQGVVIHKGPVPATEAKKPVCEQCLVRASKKVEPLVPR